MLNHFPKNFIGLQMSKILHGKRQVLKLTHKVWVSYCPHHDGSHLSNHLMLLLSLPLQPRPRPSAWCPRCARRVCFLHELGISLLPFFASSPFRVIQLLRYSWSVICPYGNMKWSYMTTHVLWRLRSIPRWYVHTDHTKPNWYQDYHIL